MKNAEIIIKLIDAGYNKKEIDEILNVGDKSTQRSDAPSMASDDTPHKAASEPAGEDKEQDHASPSSDGKAKKDDPAPDPAGYQKPVLDAIDRLTLAIQKMNITNSNIPGGDQEQAPEDIIASIINPTKGGKK